MCMQRVVGCVSAMKPAALCCWRASTSGGPVFGRLSLHKALLAQRGCTAPECLLISLYSYLYQMVSVSRGMVGIPSGCAEQAKRTLCTSSTARWHVAVSAIMAQQVCTT
jgi:hypothetical protein